MWLESEGLSVSDLRRRLNGLGLAITEGPLRQIVSGRSMASARLVLAILSATDGAVKPSDLVAHWADQLTPREGVEPPLWRGQGNASEGRALVAAYRAGAPVAAVARELAQVVRDYDACSKPYRPTRKRKATR